MWYKYKYLYIYLHIIYGIMLKTTKKNEKSENNAFYKFKFLYITNIIYHINNNLFTNNLN